MLGPEGALPGSSGFVGPEYRPVATSCTGRISSPGYSGPEETAGGRAGACLHRLGAGEPSPGQGSMTEVACEEQHCAVILKLLGRGHKRPPVENFCSFLLNQPRRTVL